MTSPALHGTGDTYSSPRVGALAARGARWLRAPQATSSLLLSALLGLLPACSDEAAPPAPMGAPVAGELDDLSVTPELTRACAEGQTQSCSLTLGEHEGLISCYEGKSSCQEGHYGPCLDGYEFTLERSELSQRSSADSAQPGLQTLAFSDAVDCANNPCNRYCREFIEAPPAGLTATPDPLATPLLLWPEGSLSSYSPESQALGLQEPCQVAGDCQFNTECIDPSLGSCGHSVCSTGDALITGCNRCADAVCAIDADCCGSQPACQHDPCDAQGAPLAATCDPCVAAVCATHPECCDTSWNAACVSYIATECAAQGQSCGCPEGSEEVGSKCYTPGDRRLDFNTAAFACNQVGTDWNLIQVDDASENTAAETLVRNASASGSWLGGIAGGVDQWIWRASAETFFLNDGSGGALQPPYTYENWGTGEPELGAFGRGLAMDTNGEWYDEASESELMFVCEGPRSFLAPRLPTFQWDASCVARAKSVCGGQCPSGVPVGTGTCEARLPTELAADCSGFDLAVGVSCENAGRPQIPVCNHGQSAAPVGLRLSYVPVSELRKATPDLTLGGDCNLSVPVPPGRCVVVDDCPGLTADSVLVVNPGGPGQDATECRKDDNWSVYQPLTCGTPLCESGTYSMQQVANAACTVTLQNPLGIDATLANVSVQSNIPEPHCGPGEELWGASCYYYPSDVQTWDRAEAACQDHGGSAWHLVALNSPAENLWVRSATDPTRDVQIGFNDQSSEGDHVWSNGSCSRYLNWDGLTLQPNNSPPGSEQCARMTPASADRWEDTDCSNDQHLYVCEGPVRDAQGACAAGERMGPDGNCYFFDPNEVSAAEAADSCSKHRFGWDLAQIDSIKLNDFVTGLIGCTPSWIRGVEPSLPGFVFTPGDPYLDELGLWQAASDGVPRASVCRGPRSLTAPQTLTQVAGASSCSGADEFYFAGGPIAPEELTLCPTTCTAASALRDNRISVSIPCAPPSTPVTTTILDQLFYAADCEGDGSVIWDFFYYDAVTPADSRIEFEVRTAQTRAELDANTIAYQPIATAQAVPVDTQRCEVNPPNCPIDIFTALGAPSHQFEQLQLRVKLIPGSSGEGPLLRDWRVRYSCPPSQ
ncbi:MAG: hypothetical protein RL685_1422 [Pseudomonadota bacterium]|jgi:hypothetical protein